MSHFASFSAAIGPWQNFYILVGTASATLIGLMFIAVTFGSSLVTPESVTTARAFFDPILAHFAQVLIVSCLMLMPTMDATVAGALLLVIFAVRLVGMVVVYRQMAAAQRRSNDIELSDWLTSIVIPGLAHLMLAASSVAFLTGYAVGFTALAVVAIVILANALYAAWEVIVWLAVKRTD
jgi:hypothetical protein